MKKLLLLTFFISAAIFPQQQKQFQIERNNQGGFNIYNDSGELIQKFTEGKY